MSHDHHHHHHNHDHHGHHHHHHHHHSDVGNIRIAFFLNLIFTIIEIIGGIMTNSMAILSDALHDLGDSFSLGLAWYLEKYSDKSRDEYYSYGYKRFSLLGALINAIILIVGSIFILTEAIPRLMAPEAVNEKGMMVLALMGILFNGAAMLQLKDGKGLNQEMVSMHLLEDVLGWVAVLVGSILMYFFDWPIIDPLLSIGISLFIIYNVFKSLRHALRIILQGTPRMVNIAQVEASVLSFEQVSSVHDIHVWTMDGAYNILTLHVVLNRVLDQKVIAELKQKIRTNLSDLHIQHATIEFEQEGEDCGLKDC